MNHATPETFKPGRMSEDERRAYEWALHQDFQSVAATYARILARYIERLPDESSVNQTAKHAGAVEGDSGQFWYYCAKCGRPLKRAAGFYACLDCEKEIKESIIHEAAQEIPEGQTFTVATQSEHNGSD